MPALRAATCERHHSFDRGRGGYLNLLVGGRLSAATTPGDTPDALAARRRFLGAGHYAPIAAAVAAVVGTPAGPVLDVGCGEGYYLSQLPLPDRFGLDVAKSAVQMAARLLPDSQFVVGSAYCRCSTALLPQCCRCSRRTRSTSSGECCSPEAAG